MRQLAGEWEAYIGWRSSVVRESWWWKDVCLIIALKVTCLKVQYAEVPIEYFCDSKAHSVCLAKSIFFQLIFDLWALNWEKTKDLIFFHPSRRLLSDFHLVQDVPTHLPMTVECQYMFRDIFWFILLKLNITKNILKFIQSQFKMYLESKQVFDAHIECTLNKVPEYTITKTTK